MPKPYFNNIKIDQIIRVNHAGEYGAIRIYQGQIAATESCFKDEDNKKLLNEMLEHELDHLNYFERLLKTRNVRPTILLPLWHRIGYLLGLCSAKININQAMLVTESVEEVIELHYQAQLEQLKSTREEDLAWHIKKFMDDEISHKNLAKNYNDSSLFNKINRYLIKKMCIVAIFLSKKI